MIRFSPSRTYPLAAAVAFGLALFSAWCAQMWPPAAVPAVLFLASAGLMAYLGTRPVVEVRDAGLAIGTRRIPWREIAEVNQTGWVSPLVMDLELRNAERVRLLYPGSGDACRHLQRLVLQHSTAALIDGVPYQELWGERVSAAAEPKTEEPRPRYRLLTEADEAEVERLYQKLKTAGHLDPEK
jgi:hypothetical protein